MPRGRSYFWDTDQSDDPVIIEREPDFVNLFKSRKPSVRIVHQEIRRPRQGADRPEFGESRERNREPRGSDESAPMSRGGRQGDFVPLPPRIPIPHQDPEPVIEIISPRPRQRPEVHQPRRNSLDLPMSRSPVRTYEPERIIARERDRRREADRQARHEARRRREAEEETEQVHRAAVRERGRRRQVDDLAQRITRVAINERETRREAEEEARRLAAEAQEADDRARQAEYALARERQLAERERAVQERLRQAEREDRAEAEVLDRRRSVHVVQRDLPLIVDRGAEVLRQAQEVERRRRENDVLYRMERDRQPHLPRRQRSITMFDDDRRRRRPV